MRTAWLFTPLALAAASPLLADDAPSVSTIGPIQDRFDDFGPAVQSLKLPSGRTVRFTDTGDSGGRTVLFIGGTGTSARAAGMTDFLGTLRRQLKLRFITVERNGFGATDDAADWGYKDYAAEVQAVLDHLGVRRFAGVAISGGGPNMAAVAGAMAEREISSHMLATAATNPAGKQCKVPLEALAEAVRADVQNPQRWWAFPANSPTHRIPGYADRAFEEGARTFFIRGQMGDPTPEAAEMLRYCGPAPDVSKVTAPVYIYQGGDDPLVTIDQANYWKSHYPKVAAFNVYPGEAHDVQYRHWDQVLIELAGFAGQTVVCDNGRSKAIPAAAVRKDMQLGSCAWARP